MTGRELIVGVSGGIAAYKTAALVSKLVQSGTGVTVVMTAAARQFIGPATFAALTGRPVVEQAFDDARYPLGAHIELAEQAQLLCVAPATANVLFKAAHGAADDLLSTLLLSFTGPVLLAPAMNCEMWEKPSVQRNVDQLRADGIHFVDPEEGWLSCRRRGVGRMAAPEKIFDAITELLNPPKLARRVIVARILITSGPTRQYIDPVRYITNASSGRMGCALATAALERGHEVIIVSGPVDVGYPAGARVIRVVSTEEMLTASQGVFGSCDGLIGVAAPSDYRPVRVEANKIAKTGEPLLLNLVETADIVATLGATKAAQWLVGFALETEDHRLRAMAKLEKKHCDLMVLNGPEAMDALTNQVEVMDRDGQVIATLAGPKEDVARGIFAVIQERLISNARPKPRLG